MLLSPLSIISTVVTWEAVSGLEIYVEYIAKRQNFQFALLKIFADNKKIEICHIMHLKLNNFEKEDMKILLKKEIIFGTGFFSFFPL